MRAHDLARALLAEPDGLVMAMDSENGSVPCSIKSVQPERHDDGDGSTTVWLFIEET